MSLLLLFGGQDGVEPRTLSVPVVTATGTVLAPGVNRTLSPGVVTAVATAIPPDPRYTFTLSVPQVSLATATAI